MRMFFYPLPRMPFIETRMPTVGDFYESLFPTIWEREIHQHYTYVLYPNHHEPSQIIKIIKIIQKPSQIITKNKKNPP